MIQRRLKYFGEVLVEPYVAKRVLNRAKLPFYICFDFVSIDFVYLISSSLNRVIGVCIDKQTKANDQYHTDNKKSA